MKKLIPILILFTGCGYTSKDNEVVGQVKKIVNETPLFCNNYTWVDISLGVFKDGIGSSSKEDLILRVKDKNTISEIKLLAKENKILKVKYNEKRFVWCGLDKFLESIEAI